MATNAEKDRKKLVRKAKRVVRVWLRDAKMQPPNRMFELDGRRWHAWRAPLTYGGKTVYFREDGCMVAWATIIPGWLTTKLTGRTESREEWASIALDDSCLKDDALKTIISQLSARPTVSRSA